MNSGLYERAGPSATARAAAWANRLLEPATKVSKVYFGLSRLLSASRERSGTAAGPPGRLSGIPGGPDSPMSRARSVEGCPFWLGPAGWLSRERGWVVVLEALVDRDRQLHDVDPELPGQGAAHGRADLVLDDPLVRGLGVLMMARFCRTPTSLLRPRNARCRCGSPSPSRLWMVSRQTRP